MTSVALDMFNGQDVAAARAMLLACADVERWADTVVAGRPYSDAAAVLEAARVAADPWSDAEIDSALARHPRIGERADGDGADAAHSRREQAGVDPADEVLAERLRAGNRAYEERFGHVFLIRAAGRSASDILAALEERLGHDAATERRVAAEQLREIAVLRLEGELA